MRWSTVIAMPLSAVAVASAFAAGPPSEPQSLLDPKLLYRNLVDRYRGLVDYSDSVTMEQRTVERASCSKPSTIERALDCQVHGGTLAVRTSDVRDEATRVVSSFEGASDGRDTSVLSRLKRASQLWLLPHLSLRFAEEPLRSMQGAGGTLVPTTVESVTIGSKEMLRLHLVSARDTSKVESNSRPSRDATVDLFVNPRSMLVERIEHSREIAEGVRYEATIEIKPARASPAPAKTLDPAGEPATDAPRSLDPGSGDHDAPIQPKRAKPAAEDPVAQPPAPPAPPAPLCPPTLPAVV
ncbi:MAG: hypothetical protein SGJ09_16785 [Phycisphaerae bacterium]|nr:hypothetical protein [Phycisphaerae bacterium]